MQTLAAISSPSSQSGSGESLKVEKRSSSSACSAIITLNRLSVSVSFSIVSRFYPVCLHKLQCGVFLPVSKTLADIIFRLHVLKLSVFYVMFKMGMHPDSSLYGDKRGVHIFSSSKQ